MTHPTSDDPVERRLLARRQVLRTLYILRLAFNEADAAFSELTALPDTHDEVTADYPFAHSFDEVAFAMQAWYERVHATFTSTDPKLDPNDSPLAPAAARLALSPEKHATLGTLVAAFHQATGTHNLAHAAAAYFALTAADNRTDWATDTQPEEISSFLGVLGTDIDGAIDNVGSAVHEANAPAAGSAHPAIASPDSPFAGSTFAPVESLIRHAGRACTQCGRSTPQLAQLPACRAIRIEHNFRAEGTESGIVDGVLSIDGWFFTDTESPAGFVAECPHEYDVACDVRPYDERYCLAYLDQFLTHDGPINPGQRFARMMEVVGYDPFGPPQP
jgi:hypothetical protein